MNTDNSISSDEESPLSPRFSKMYEPARVENYGPFILYKDGSYMISAETDLKILAKTYRPLFQRYGYLGSGYTWEGLIKQILEQEDPPLLDHLDFDGEGGGFYVFADSEITQRQFAEQLGAIFTDVSRLEEYIRSADRNRIDS